MIDSSRPVLRTSLAMLLLALVSPLRAIELSNAGFEISLDGPRSRSGWEISTYEQIVERDLDIKTEGRASLRISASSPQTSTMLRQTFPADPVRHGAIRLAGKIRSEDLQGTATLFVVVNDSKTRIFVDDMRGRPVQGNSEWTAVEIRVPRMLDAQTIEMGVLMIGSGTAWFDDLTLDQVEINDPTSDEAADYLRAALDILEERSIHSPDANWEALREGASIAASGSQSPADTYPAIRYVLRRLGDSHSSLFTPERVGQVTAEGPDSTRLPKWQSPSGTVVKGKIAQISVPSYSGTNRERMTAYADELQARIRELDAQDICGWIVDLRQNRGGNVFPMLAGIGPVLGDGVAGGGVAVDGTEVVRTYAAGRSGKASVSGDAYELRSPLPAVAVLLGPNTASSGEAVALAFIGRPNTATFGAATAGYTTGNVPIPLSDGAVLNLAVTKMMDRNGKVYDGPITPDFPVAADADPEVDGVVERAAAWLESSKSCTNPG